MPLVKITNRQGGAFVVPPPVAKKLNANSAVEMVLDASQLEDPALTALAQRGLITVEILDNPSAPDATEGANRAQLAGLVKTLSLSAATEAGQAIVVTGQVKDGLGANVAAAAQVLVEVVAPTVAKGQITVTSGTEKVTVNDGAGKIHRSWIETTAGGAFAVSVADDQVEQVLITVRGPDNAVEMLKLIFAA